MNDICVYTYIYIPYIHIYIYNLIHYKHNKKTLLYSVVVLIVYAQSAIVLAILFHLNKLHYLTFVCL